MFGGEDDDGGAVVVVVADGDLVAIFDADGSWL